MLQQIGNDCRRAGGAIVGQRQGDHLAAELAGDGIRQDGSGRRREVQPAPGPGPLLAFGMGLIALGMLLLSMVDAGGTWAGGVFVPSIITAAGIGFSFVPVAIAAVSGVRPAEAALGGGAAGTSRDGGVAPWRSYARLHLRRARPGVAKGAPRTIGA